MLAFGGVNGWAGWNRTAGGDVVPMSLYEKVNLNVVVKEATDADGEIDFERLASGGVFVWPCKSSDGDYHDHVHASNWLKFFEFVCSILPAGCVFHIDNASYHKSGNELHVDFTDKTTASSLARWLYEHDREVLRSLLSLMVQEERERKEVREVPPRARAPPPAPAPVRAAPQATEEEESGPRRSNRFRKRKVVEDMVPHEEVDTDTPPKPAAPAHAAPVSPDSPELVRELDEDYDDMEDDDVEHLDDEQLQKHMRRSAFLRDNIEALKEAVQGSDKFSKFELEVQRIARDHGHFVLFTPPYLCDLQPIENVWGILKRFVGRMATYDNSVIKEMLNVSLPAAFKDIDPEKWANSVRRACEHRELLWKRWTIQYPHLLDVYSTIMDRIKNLPVGVDRDAFLEQIMRGDFDVDPPQPAAE